MNSNEKPSQSYFLERQGKFMRRKNARKILVQHFLRIKLTLCPIVATLSRLATRREELLRRFEAFCSLSGEVLVYLLPMF